MVRLLPLTRAWIWIVVCLLVLPAGSELIAAPADGVVLTVTLNPGTIETVLEWTGGQPVFTVYRSAAPNA